MNFFVIVYVFALYRSQVDKVLREHLHHWIDLVIGTMTHLIKKSLFSSWRYASIVLRRDLKYCILSNMLNFSLRFSIVEIENQKLICLSKLSSRNFILGIILFQTISKRVKVRLYWMAFGRQSNKIYKNWTIWP